MAKEVITEYYNQAAKTRLTYDWWNKKEDDIHESVIPLVSRISENQSLQNSENLKFARLYGNQNMLGLSAVNYSTQVRSDLPRNKLTLNIVASCVDTAAAKIAKSKPRPMFLTHKGNWTQKKKGEQLTYYMDGLFDLLNLYEKGQMCFVDAGVFGTGVIHFYIDDGSIQCERILSDELVVDDIDGMYGTPQQMHRKKLYSRDILIAKFPSSKHSILACPAVETPAGQNTVVDQVRVIESWHLPSRKGFGDGLHSICIEGATLHSNVYDKDYFPFCIFRWSPKLLGFFGCGLAEQLIGIQLEINKVLRVIQQAQNLMCVPRIFIEEGSKVNAATITNEVGSLIRYRGTMPQMVVGQGMPAETYSYLENLINKGYAFIGVSQLSATAKKPAGLDSGIALREYQDIESERFMLTALRYEKFYMDCAKIIVDLSRDLYLDNPKLNVKSRTAKFVQTIKWRDVDLRDDEFEMQMYPVSLLPTSPAGKLQTVQDLVQGQLMSGDEALSLLNFPDLDGFTARKDAARDNIERRIEMIIEKGESGYRVPDKIMNLELADELTRQAIQMGENDGLPEERVELLRSFLDSINALQLSNAPAPPEPVQGMPAQPAEAPVSDLMPIPQGPQ